MLPIRVDAAAVEPVTLSELRGYLRLDPDDGGAEDALLLGLIAAARASLEAETRRILVPGTWRVVLGHRPRDGLVPLPLSPLVAVARAEFRDADGVSEAAPNLVAPNLVALGPDRIEAPCLVIAPAPVPAWAAGRCLVVDVVAGFGGEGPALPPPLRLAVLRLAAARYEHRGDDSFPDTADLTASAAPFRRLRL